MTTYRFHEVKVSAKRSGSCPACGKRVTRSRTFTQTVNPFNRRDDGTPKTPSEVYEAVKAEAQSWSPDFTHEQCRDAA